MDYYNMPRPIKIILPIWSFLIFLVSNYLLIWSYFSNFKPEVVGIFGYWPPILAIIIPAALGKHTDNYDGPLKTDKVKAKILKRFIIIVSSITAIYFIIAILNIKNLDTYKPIMRLLFSMVSLIFLHLTYIFSFGIKTKGWFKFQYSFVKEKE